MHTPFAEFLTHHGASAAALAGGPVSSVHEAPEHLELTREDGTTFHVVARGYDPVGDGIDAPAHPYAVPDVPEPGIAILPVPSPDAATWAEVAERHPDLATYARRHRLVFPEPLPPVGGDDYVARRDGLHRLTEVVAAAREAATGHEIALRPHSRGILSPPIPEAGGLQPALLLEGEPTVAVLPGPGVDAAGLSPRAAARHMVEGFAGHGVHLSLDPGGYEDTPVPRAPGGFGDLVAFGRALLARARSTASTEATPIRLWPEHFDQAFTDGKVTFGVAPGDDDEPLPYLYILRDTEGGALPPGGRWQTSPWHGAVLPYSVLTAQPTGDAALELGLAFFAAGRDPIE